MTTSNLMKYKKHLSSVMAFNYWIFFLISALLTGCSSSNDDNEEQVKNNLTIDLRPYLPSKNSQVFIDNKVDHDAWYFWVDSDFSYKFEITAYTNNSMKLKLVESDFRFADYEEKYPLRTSVGTELTLERSIRE